MPKDFWYWAVVVIVFWRGAAALRHILGTIGQTLSGDSDLAVANSIHPAVGTDVLRRQVEREQREPPESGSFFDFLCLLAGIGFVLYWALHLISRLF